MGLPTASPDGARGSASTAAPIVPAAFGSCNPVSTKTPSALLQGIAEPPKNLTPGGNLSAIMEVAALNWTPADSNISVLFPSVYFNFFTTTGKVQLYLSNRSFAMTFSGWSSPKSATTRNVTFPAGLSFELAKKAVIDSMKLAVEATADYGQITIEVRWQWVYQPHPGVTVHGAWSVPTTQANWPATVPSIFWPAPYAQFLGGTGLNGTIGTNWTATLGGDVAARTFFLEMEDPSGTVVTDSLQTAPANGANYTVHLLLLNYNSYLPPGAYLVHVHDACGAMLYSKTVHAVFAPSASVRFFVTPSACAGRSITFNGTKFSNNTVGTFGPSATPYIFSIPFCPGGHTFHSWFTTGALHVVTGKSMDISYNGTFTVQFN